MSCSILRTLAGVVLVSIKSSTNSRCVSIMSSREHPIPLCAQAAASGAMAFSRVKLAKASFSAYLLGIFC